MFSNPGLATTIIVVGIGAVIVIFLVSMFFVKRSQGVNKKFRSATEDEGRIDDEPG